MVGRLTSKVTGADGSLATTCSASQRPVDREVRRQHHLGVALTFHCRGR